MKTREKFDELSLNYCVLALRFLKCGSGKLTTKGEFTSSITFEGFPFILRRVAGVG